MTLLQKLTKEQIDPYFLEWADLQKKLEQMHRNRDAEVEKWMRKGLVIYKQLVAHCEDSSIDKKMEPINGKERLAFIEKRPEIFVSYCQLQELFVEMKKIIAGTRVKINNLSNQ